MKLHRNAKTTPKMRKLLIDRADAPRLDAGGGRDGGWRRPHRGQMACERAADDGRTTDDASCPHRQPRRLAIEPMVAILAHRHRRATAWEISAAVRGAPVDGRARVASRGPTAVSPARAAARDPVSRLSGRTLVTSLIPT